MSVGRLARAITVALALTSCRTTTPEPRKTPANPADLACNADADCTIRKGDFGSCCQCDSSSSEPFAISTRANAVWSESCANVTCTMEYCDEPVGRRIEDFRAVCVNHACERRAKG